MQYSYPITPILQLKDTFGSKSCRKVVEPGLSVSRCLSCKISDRKIERMAGRPNVATAVDLYIVSGYLPGIRVALSSSHRGHFNLKSWKYFLPALSIKVVHLSFTLFSLDLPFDILHVIYYTREGGDFPGSPMAKTPHSHCRGAQVWSLVRELDPTCPDQRVHVPQLKILHVAKKIPRIVTKTGCHQMNKY